MQSAAPRPQQILGGLILLAPLSLAGGGIDFGGEEVITEGADGALSVWSADIDGDGDADVLSASWIDATIAWYENTDGEGVFGSAQVISSTAYGARSVATADFDGDGDQDVLAAIFDLDLVAWYENTDGLGSFGPAQTITDSADGVRRAIVTDLDQDLDPDVLAISSNDGVLAWYENLEGTGEFGPGQLITGTLQAGFDACVADVDGDDDLDVLSADYGADEIAWYENDGGEFSAPRLIAGDVLGALSVAAGDVDGDGDIDAISAAYVGDRFDWYENLDGLGTFGPARLLDDELNGAACVAAVDLDQDDDTDILAATKAQGRVFFFENLDGLGDFKKRTVTNSPNEPRCIAVADLDGDNDEEVLVASTADDTVAWYDNIWLPWDFLGNQLAGTGDISPALAGSGDLLPGTTATLSLDDALADAPAFLVASLDQIDLPFKGGVMVPDPDVVIGVLVDPNGELEVQGTWPEDTPGRTTVLFQYWVVDPGGPEGFSASNAISGTSHP